MAKTTHGHGGAMATTPWRLKSRFSSLLPLLSALTGLLVISVTVFNTNRPQTYLSTIAVMARAADQAKNPTNAGTATPSPSIVSMENPTNAGTATPSPSIVSMENPTKASTATPSITNASAATSSIVSMKKVDQSPTCDFFDGRWVYDESTHPLYPAASCSSLPDEVACDRFGRKDTGYQHWRWQPHGCDLPRFNGTKLLERLRGKRMLFVGDSLNRNQWSSMVCLLESSIPAGHMTIDSEGSLMSFKAKDYNASVDFYWAPLLLESNCDDREQHRIPDRIIKTPSIENHARNWADADILVFSSYVWWMKPAGFKLKVLDGVLMDNNVAYEIDMIQGFELALKTWSNWLRFQLEAHKKQIYFVSLSPLHGWGEDWGAAAGRNCYNETEPIKEVGYQGRGTVPAMMRKVEEAIAHLRDNGVNVNFLNTTQLSDYRKDGHPSIYKRQWNPLSPEQIANPTSYADCVHWCLPGVPDTWNEILYANIFGKQHKEL